MERLEIGFEPAVDNNDRLIIHRAARELKNLKQLITSNNEDCYMIQGAFPELVELELVPNYSDLNDVFEGTEVPKLKCFKFEVSQDTKFGNIIKDVMPNLEELEIFVNDLIFPEELTEEILLLPQLRTLKISYDEFAYPFSRWCDVKIKDHYILKLVKGLPKLTNLQIKLQYDVMDYDTMRELLAYLQENNRRLQFIDMVLY